MGVPKFYRWISERYPCLSEVVREHEMPEFDNLYLDMNGIIHVCSHPDDGNPHFRITEEKIFADIFHYIEVLFRLIKPKKVFFMAVDGVAPRAKMNQQRGRRFRSAQEAELLEKKALEKGEVLPTEARFDSNCITPGTEFMARLQEQLKYFVAKKITTDKMWQGPRIYLSGHEVPGEGEHKVMDFIRYEKSQPEYDHDTRHCLYGLDADLMMLGLASHEPHFSLLREEVRFGSKESQKRSSTVEETTFHLLHLTLFREYLDFEFSDLRDKLSFGYDLERIIDDWVLMGFLVGNDFIPHLPHLHIHQDALPLLWRVYKTVMPTLDGYLHDGGTLNLPRFEKFLRELSKHDLRTFADTFDDMQYMKGKRAEAAEADTETTFDEMREKLRKEQANFHKKRDRDSISSAEAGIISANQFAMLLEEERIKDVQLEDEDENDLQKALGVMPLEKWDDGMTLDELAGSSADGGLQGDIELFNTNDLDDCYSDELLFEFRRHKNAYYTDKMGFTNVTDEILADQAYQYVRALQWILHYYYNGCVSWSWFYPHHYAPYLSDVRNFGHHELEYDLNKPFKPFEQLMAVLPSASKKLLPEPMQRLMCDYSSPILDFYPKEFELDMNGKQQEWEAVVVIPFIDEHRLLAAMKPEESKMTDEEKGRNSHGPHMLFQYTPESQGTYISMLPDSFPNIVNHKAKITSVHQDLFRLKPHEIYKGLCSGVSLDVYFVGFPTMKHLPHTYYLERAEVKVFQHNSRGENMILRLDRPDDTPELEVVAKQLLGQSVYVSWPHMSEARVVAASDGLDMYTIIDPVSHKQSAKVNNIDVKVERLDSDGSTKWMREAQSIVATYKKRRGVDIGDPEILLYCTSLTGKRYVVHRDGTVSVENQWSSLSLPYAYHACAQNLRVKLPSMRQYNTVNDLYEPDSDAFMLGHPHYGCHGKVLEVNSKNDNRVRVNFIHTPEPNIKQIFAQRTYTEMYYRGWTASEKLGISSHLVSRITGTVYVTLGSVKDAVKEGNRRTNVGFNMKFNKTGKQVPGYTKKDPNDNEWYYSQRCIDFINEYIEEFPDLFEYLSKHTNEDNFLADKIFGEGKGEKRLNEIKEYLKGTPFAKIEPADFGTEVIGDGLIALLEKEVDNAKQEVRKKRIKMQVKPHLLFRPTDSSNNAIPDPTTTFELLDRVVNVREGFTVPLGLRGTVIGIRNAKKEGDILYEVLFDEDFIDALSIRCSTKRAYRLPGFAMINITHGERKQRAQQSGSGGAQKPTAVVKPQHGSHQHHGGQQGDRSPRQPNQHHGGRGRQDGGAYSNLVAAKTEGRSFQNLQQNMANPQIYGKQFAGNQFPANQPFVNPQQQYGGVPSQMFFNQQMRGGMRPSGPQMVPQFNPYAMNQQFRPQMPQAPPAQDAMFLGMWNQLQKSKDFPATWNKSDPRASTSNPDTRASSSNKHDNRFGGHNKTDNSAGHKGQQHAQARPGPSLNAAAQALSKSHVNPAYPQHPGLEDGAGQRIDLNTLFSSAKQPAQSTSSDSQQDFNRLMSALQVSEDKTDAQTDSSQKGTQALQQILGIGKSQKTESDIKPLMSVDTVKSSSGVFSKQVSVQELLTGVEKADKQKEGSQSKSKQKGKTNQSKKNAMSELYNYCAAQGLASPRYDYASGRDNKVQATVHVGQGFVFKGSFSRDRQHATDSAASVALFNLQQQAGLAGMMSPLKIPPPPSQGQQEEEDNARFAPSPNSAFVPVRGKTGQHSGYDNNERRHQKSHRQQPFPNPPFAPNAAPQQAFLHTRHQGQDHRGQGHYSNEYRNQGHQGKGHQGHYSHGQRGAGGGHGPSLDNRSNGAYSNLKRNQHDFNASGGRVEERRGSEEDKSQANPFVPLQVMKKQHTPRKEGSQDSTASTDAETDRQLVAPKQCDSSKNCNISAAGPFNSSEDQVQASTRPKSETKRKKKEAKADKSGESKRDRKAKQPPRPKSRIAANFFNVPNESES